MSRPVPQFAPLVQLLRTTAAHAVISLTEPVSAGSRRNALRAVTSGQQHAQARADAARALDEQRGRTDPVASLASHGAAERR